MNPDTDSATDRLLAAAEGAALPEPVLVAWTSGPPLPAVGQLWRAAWEGTAELVLLLAVEGDVLEVAVVTTDVGYADDTTVILPTHATPLKVELGVWIGLRRKVPARVLDRHLGSVGGAWAGTAALERAVTHGDASNGDAVVSGSDPRGEYRARLADALEGLAQAQWVPSGNGRLASLLRSAGLQPAELVSTLDISPQDALALLRSRLSVSLEQAERLAPTLAMSATEVLRANPQPPADLVARLDDPRRRSQLRAVAARRGQDERAARLAVAYGTLRLAARQTGGSDGPDWDSRLDRYFDVALDEPVR